ncbi:MAG: tetratricopeptide repeat protein [Deltaproteobacteria bacterium]|nr:tetratricopeptide repeat protein [Deltaproteobacteria bacterium]
MKRRGIRGWALTAVLAALTAPSVARSQDLGDVGSQLTVLEGQTAQIGQLATSAASGAARQGPDYQERFADAELLYRLRDYARSAVLFTDIVENYANTPAFPQGLYLLGDALFQAGDRYGARTRFRQVLDHAGEPVFRPFVQRALGRLIEIEIALGANDDESSRRVEEYFRRLGQIPPSEIEAQTTYTRGKFLFLRGTPDLDGARQAFEAIPATAPLYPQARYFLGAILTVRQQYPEAIEAFQRVSQLEAEGPEQQRVIDLSILAVGRLQVERESFDAAIESYQRIGRNSSYFDRALFEQAWAYIKLGDAIRAERALEILAISAPDSPLIPEGKLLWGNLLLRTGRFQRAQQVFQEVRDQFGPIYQQITQATDRANPELYFRELIRSNLQVFDASSFLPAQALAWVRQEGGLDNSMRVISDLNTCRTYVREATDLIDRLNAALNAPSRSHVFQDLGRARQRVWQVLNRSSQLRESVALAMDRGADAGNVDLQGIISQRRALAAQIGRLPTDDDGLRRRDRQADNELQTLSQTLQRNQQRVDGLEAMVVAIERYLADPSHQSATLDRTTLQTELSQQRAALQQYRDRVTNIRRMISAARSQIGPGDPGTRTTWRCARSCVTSWRARRRPCAPPGGCLAEAEGLLARLDRLDQGIGEADGRINTLVDQRVLVITNQVREEESRVAGFRERLGALEREAEDVVGNLIQQQFRQVRLQFYQIVMRADLGLVDVAWEEREEHNNRARLLAEEQNREISRSTTSSAR